MANWAEGLSQDGRNSLFCDSGNCRDGQCGVKIERGGPLSLTSSSLGVLFKGSNVRKNDGRERRCGEWMF